MDASRQRRWASVPALAMGLILSACGGGGEVLAPPLGDDDTTPPVPAGDVIALARGYLDVVQTSPQFDECRTETPAREPHLCLRGPRSGSGLDAAVHDWMQQQWSAIPGLTPPQTQTFPFPQFRPADWSLQVDLGQGLETLATFPWYGQGVTDEGGIEAPLVVEPLLGGTRGLAGGIALLRFTRQFNADAANTHERLREVEAAGAVAAVATFDAPDNLINAHNYNIARGLGRLPTLIVGKEDHARLRQAAGQNAQLRLTGAVSPGTGRNSLTVLPGASDRLLVIGTPMNTWLTGGGERAPGAAVLIDLAQHLARRRQTEGDLPYTVLFIASGGHEIFGFGLERVLSCLPPERVHAYVHLGAGLVSRFTLEVGGTAVQGSGLSQTRSLSHSENPVLESIVVPAFRRVGPYFRFNAGQAAPGESFIAYNFGIPMFSFTGANPYHHTPLDDAQQIVFERLPDMASVYREVVDGLIALSYDELRAANAEAEAGRRPNPGYPCAGPIDGL